VVGNDSLCLLKVYIVLRCARHDDVNLLAPRLLAREELYAELISIVLNFVAAGSSHLKHVVDLLFGYNSIRIVDVSIRTRQGNGLSAQLSKLLCSAPCYVAESGKSNGLTFDGIVLML